VSSKHALISSASPKRIPASEPLQAKRSISIAGEMAGKVKRMEMSVPVNFSSSKNTINRKCAHCEEEEKQLQRKEGSVESNSVAPPIVHDVLNSSGGRSMDTDTRSFMEPRFNYDFSSVKIHDNDIAAKSANSINALAYTSGNNIVFNSGQYNTNSNSGKRLLAHELTHIVQQENKSNNKINRWAIGPAPAPGDWAEVTDAEQIRRLGQAEAIVRGVLTSRRCQNFFSSGCGAPTALQDAFDNARIYLIPVDDNVFGARQSGSADIAFNLRSFRIGRFMMASTLLHEMFHTCDPTPRADQNTRELNSENAVEACRLHTPWIDQITPGRSAPGTRILISGWGFGPVRSRADRVLIGGVSARIFSWDFTTDASSRVEIVAEVPPGASGGDVIVINNGVESNTASFTIL
jgi:hypothetical protein